MKVVTKVPGKLFLAGEYAVVESGNPAVIAAVDLYLTVSIESAESGMIHSTQQSDMFLTWYRTNEQILVSEENPYQIVLTALQVSEEFLREQGIPCQGYYSVTIQSELDDQDSGTKYGLGSSGAVTVATVEAILLYYGYELDPLLVFKLSVLTQARLNMTGSHGDLAASSFRGLVAYYSLDKSWLSEQMSVQGLSNLLASDWKDLQIKQIGLPAPLELLVGWTGSAASTTHLVSHMESKKTQQSKEEIYSQFLNDSKVCVEQLIWACQNRDIPCIKQAVTRNRYLLRKFSEDMSLTIETPLLTELCDSAEANGAVAKSSGAGGGDCGICLVDSQEQKEAIQIIWEQAGIFPLPLTIAERNKERI